MVILVKREQFKINGNQLTSLLTRHKYLQTKTRCITFNNYNITNVAFNIIIIIILTIVIYSQTSLNYL